MFLKQFNLNNDLLKLQRLYVRDLDHEYPFKAKFNYNWFEYIINDTELTNKPFLMEFDVIDKVKDLNEYRENLYYKKRQ